MQFILLKLYFGGKKNGNDGKNGKDDGKHGQGRNEKNDGADDVKMLWGYVRRA